ncbi:MAG: class I SAM-dependent methyltransferase [Spirochaetes bacterium]|nr:class I SAM-dependent methyltransferase [Spirochaetota bacterium]
MYQNPQPVFDDLKTRYQEEYFQYELENESNFFNLMKLGLEDIRFSNWEPLLREQGSFLDVGCATGMLLSFMQERGWKVQGVEICEASAKYGMTQRRVPIFIGTLEDAPFKKETFSFIHASHLIEHLTDPVGFLLRVHTLLKEGGQFVLVTPNRSGFQARLLRNRWRSCIPDHLHLFSKRTLSWLVQNKGFKILHIQTWGGIAKGLAPRWIKGVLDRAAKRYGFGDVMLFHLEKV